jgi:hypothetical protein
MLTQVEIRTTAGALLTLELEDVSDGLVLQDIQGLDPVKATIVSTGYANADVQQFQGARREARNIIFVIGLDPDYITTDVRDLRTRLYDYFMPKDYVEIRFYDSSGLTVNITGYVEELDAPLFSRNPVANISVLCLDSDFIDVETLEIDGNTVSTSAETLVDYPGTIEVGFELVLNVDRVLSDFTIYHRAPDSTVRSLTFEASLVAGDVVTIGTVFGNKFATLTRAGVNSSLLYGVTNDSAWLEFQKGASNYIRVYATGAAIPYSITYTPRYGGL